MQNVFVNEHYEIKVYRSSQITDGALLLMNTATQKLKLLSKLWRLLSNLRILKTSVDKHPELKNSTLIIALVVRLER